MIGRFRLLTGAATVLLLSGACTSSTSPTADVSPFTSPSASPSASPSPSPSPTTEPSPSPSPSGALAITNLPFHNGEVGIRYLAVTLGASGGTAPYQWAVSGGAFPPGLTLSQDGTITGVNTTAGQFKFTVKVTDSAGASTTSAGGFGVFAALSATQPCANQCTVGAGCTRCGGFGAVSGGLGPYTYKVVGGFVPDGMSLNGLSLKGGFPPSPLGAYNLSVQVTDQFTATTTVNANWFVYNPATLLAGNSCNDFASNTPGSCSASGWSYTNNAPTDPAVVIVGTSCPIDFSCSPNIPINFSAVTKGGTITITASLPASADCNTYQYDNEMIYTIALVDKSSCPTAMRSNTADLQISLHLVNCG